MMDWLRQIAPTIATALGGPLAGLAVDAISKAVGIDPKDVNKTIADCLAVKAKYPKG